MSFDPPSVTPRPMAVRVAAALAVFVLVVALPLGVYLYGNASARWRPLAGAFLVAAIGVPIFVFLRTRGKPGASRDGVKPPDDH